MKVPVEITYRNLEKSEVIDNLVREKIAKLEQFCNHITSCRVAIEKNNERPSSGSPYRVRFDITVPPSHEIAAVCNPGEGDQYDELDTVIRHAYEAARRQVVELTQRQNNKVKDHPAQEMGAIVSKLFPEDGYGFIKTLDNGREIYFHRNSVSGDRFDELKEGAGVHFSETQGEMGPQATTVHLVNKLGTNEATEQQSNIEQPLGWK